MADRSLRCSVRISHFRQEAALTESVLPDSIHVVYFQDGMDRLHGPGWRFVLSVAIRSEMPENSYKRPYQFSVDLSFPVEASIRRLMRKASCGSMDGSLSDPPGAIALRSIQFLVQQTPFRE